MIMADHAIYGSNIEVVPAGVANALLKRTVANDGWEFKTAAQLGLAPTLLQTTFTEVTVDTTTGSGVFVDLISQVITITAGSIILISFTASASNTSQNTTIDFQLMIDGVATRGTGMRTSSTTAPQGNAITYRKTGLAVGAHTIKIQWRTGGGTARVRPVATAIEHASLLCQEVTV